MKFMLNKKFVVEKINLITRDLGALQRFSSKRFSDLAGDYYAYAALKNILMEIIGRAIDINDHLIAKLSLPENETPKSYKESFLLLAELGVLPEKFAREIAKSAGFRNAIVHEYNNIDKEIVYQTVGQAIDQYKSYCKYILKFLEKAKIK